MGNLNGKILQIEIVWNFESTLVRNSYITKIEMWIPINISDFGMPVSLVKKRKKEATYRMPDFSQPWKSRRQ